MVDRERARRSCLAVPGSSDKMIGKAQTLDADEIFLDLEDSVAPAAKAEARGRVVAALNEGDWSGKVRVVRINATDTPWAGDDLIEIVRGAGANLDVIMLPKAEHVSCIHWLDTMLSQLEHSEGLEVGRIGIEAQIEGPRGLKAIDEIAAASDRMETLVFGPGDFTAAMKIPSLSIGAAEGYDPFDSVRMEIAMAARRHGLQAIDGPFSLIRDLDGYTRSASKAAQTGYDGKWVLHPGQLPLANEAFSPSQDDYDRAEYMLEAYAHATSTSGGAVGAIMVGDDMVDEASAKMATPIAEAGRRFGMTRTTRFEAP